MTAKEMGGSFEQYEEGRSPQGALVYRAFFRPENDKNVFVLPGDCFPPAAYFPLAEQLCRTGSNAFVIDYVAACEERVPDRELRNAHCSDAVVRVIQEIRGRFPHADGGGADYLLGHSRGAHVGVGALGRIQAGGGMLLHAPYFRWKHARYPLSLPLAFEVAPQLMSRDRVTLRFDTFRRRFFGDALPLEEAKRHYAQSRGIPRGLLLDKEEVNLDVLRATRLFIYLYADDNALPAVSALRTVHSLTKVLGLKPNVTMMPGAHCEIITSPRACAEHMVELCLS